MPTCQWAHLCDHAFYDQAGKVCLIGIFDRVAAPRVPVQHNQAVLAFRLAGEPGERREVRVALIRPDGQDPLVDLSNPRVEFGPAGEHQAVIQLQNLTLPDFGPYEVRILVDERLVATVPFSVVRAGQA